MLDSFPVLLAVCSALGFLAGLGVGGGSLLILWITLVLHMPHSEARIINLLFFIPSALIASLFRWKQGQLKISKVLPAIVAGCIFAAVCSLISKNTSVDLIKRLFGGLLLITGVRELFYRPRNAR